MTGSQQMITVGEMVARFLEQCGVGAAFGVISIHNMPILDAIGIRDRVRFVPARGEAGAVNMADAYARVSGGLGVAFTSTGTAAGNAAGALVEAITAGSPVLHITGQIETEHLGRDRAYIHEAPAQAEMLSAVCKSCYTVTSPRDVLNVLRRATQDALTAPRGPVSVELPIDVQQALVALPADMAPLPVADESIDQKVIADLVSRIRAARRPMLLLGGGARGAAAEATLLADLGFGIVTSTNGRAIVPENHPRSLGAFNVSPQVEKLYAQCDLMIVVGSRMRSNETWTYELKFPDNLVVVDVDPRANGRTYPNRHFVRGDAQKLLAGLVDGLDGQLTVEATFDAEIDHARTQMVDHLREGLGPYTQLVDQLQAQFPNDAVWVRDVTVSNSTWGNRYLKIGGPRNAVHALGGGIGQGMPMAVGAAVAAGARKTILLTGDGGFCLCIGELFTAAQEGEDILILMMNDAGYGVIRNIQDAMYGSRKYYSNILIPDFSHVCQSVGMAHQKVASLDDFSQALGQALAVKGPAMLEVDMTAIGPYPHKFAGPPVLQSA